MQTIYLVACCDRKLREPAPARLLYRSCLFRLAREYAEAAGGRWVILSALHGVVLPEQVIAPYDVRMPSSREAAERWAQGVASALQQLAGEHPTRFVSLCGAEYTRHLGDLHPHVIEHPLAGLAIGKRLQWLKQHTAALASSPLANGANDESSR